MASLKNCKQEVLSWSWQYPDFNVIERMSRFPTGLDAFWRKNEGKFPQIWRKTSQLAKKQNNNPEHTSRSTEKVDKEDDKNVLEWSSKSPDPKETNTPELKLLCTGEQADV